MPKSIKSRQQTKTIYYEKFEKIGKEGFEKH